MKRIPFAIIGSGWRAEFFLRVARACPELFEVVGVVARNAPKRDSLRHDWGVRTFSEISELVEKTRPLFAVTCVPCGVNVVLIRELVECGIPVLSETPPAPDLEDLIELNELVGKGARIQVAEQYHLQPHHAARLAVVQSGILGAVSQVHVSAAHGYHGISLMRRLLGITYENCAITGHAFASPLMAGPDRAGLPRREEIRESTQETLTFDFGDKRGVYDFTEDQYFSWIRNERVLVRGERGEMINQEVICLKDFLTPVRQTFVRHAAGADGNLEGNYLRGIQFGEEWVYKNPFIPARLTDDEIAIASCLEGMAHYLATGEDFYSLAEASQDQYLALLCEQALRQDQRIRTEQMPWAVESTP